MNYRILILAAAVVAAAGCSRGGSQDHAFEWVNALPAGAVVHLRDGSGNIEVHRASGSAVSVVGNVHWHRSRARDVKFTVEHVGNDYYVCAMWRNSGRCGASGYHGRQTNTFLAMFSLFHRSSDAAADFVASLPANVVVDAKTDFGTVTVDGILGGVTARTIVGDVVADNVSGPLSLVTTNGNVHVAADSLSTTDAVHLEATNGTVDARLPENLQGAFDLSVVNGHVTSDFPLDAAPQSRAGRHLKGQIGESQRVVKMRTVTGNVFVTTRAAHVQH